MSDHDNSHRITVPMYTTTTTTTGIPLYERVLATTRDFYEDRPKEKTMTTLEKVAAERREAAERARIDASYAAWDALGLDGLPELTVARFNAQTGSEDPIHPGATFVTYAALAIEHPSGGLRWWVTGSSSPSGSTTEDLLAWMIGRSVDVDSWEVLS